MALEGSLVECNEGAQQEVTNVWFGAVMTEDQESAQYGWYVRHSCLLEEQDQKQGAWHQKIDPQASNVFLSVGMVGAGLPM